MSVSTLDVEHFANGVVYLNAEGGNRRERAAVIGAYARQHNLRRSSHAVYSETYGFQTLTSIRYVTGPHHDL